MASSKKGSSAARRVEEPKTEAPVQENKPAQENKPVQEIKAVASKKAEERKAEEKGDGGASKTALTPKKITHEMISKRAYELWQKEGGSERENWLKAERQLQTENR